MTDVVVLSSVLSVAFALFALLLVGLLLRWFDGKADIVFKDWVSDVQVKEKHEALAIYFGLRFLGACLLVGLVIN